MRDTPGKHGHRQQLYRNVNHHDGCTSPQCPPLARFFLLEGQIGLCLYIPPPFSEANPAIDAVRPAERGITLCLIERLIH